jgi:hypothetical protein
MQSPVLLWIEFAHALENAPHSGSIAVWCIEVSLQETLVGFQFKHAFPSQDMRMRHAIMGCVFEVYNFVKNM